MLAAIEGSAATVVVVTTALRTIIEARRDHVGGLALVRSELARFAATLPRFWRAGFYGKDLVAVVPGAEPNLAMALGETLPADSPVRMGWSWTVVPLSGPPSRQISTLLAACYRAAVAARVRRSHSSLRTSEAVRSLEEWRSRRPGPDERDVASMLAAVLVRPYGDQEIAAEEGDDPRWPGVRRGDRIEELSGAQGMPLYVITDVHGIEWGSAKGPMPTAGTKATTSVEGNAARLIPAARAWLAAERSTSKTLDIAYSDRLEREQALAVHLRDLGRQPGMLFGTLGDGLEGMVSSIDRFRTVLATTNAAGEGRIRSGAGAARAQGTDAADRDVARRSAEFSLHVTKLLTPEDTPFAAMHVFGELLPEREALIVLGRLLRLRDHPNHHFHHARHHADTWLRHLPPASHRKFTDVVGEPLHSQEAGFQRSGTPP
ncbi:hypothetical protein ACIBKY_28980 [Nonomuraea sp. NPDC050394]|uniref:hypothetical protein n=1 Tax=Nonomuraea sp. NPDC050394 TaxID=3364363 RepID=UPI00379ED5F2